MRISGGNVHLDACRVHGNVAESLRSGNAAAAGGIYVQAGDVLLGVASSGLHSNGYSLARRVLTGAMGLDYGALVADLGCTVGEALLKPTRIYAKAVAAVIARTGEGLHALAHITGGGMLDNIPRVIPKGLAPRVELASYQRPALFEVLAKGGPVEESELRRTFNLGVGLVVVVRTFVTFGVFVVRYRVFRFGVDFVRVGFFIVGLSGIRLGLNALCGCTFGREIGG